MRIDQQVAEAYSQAVAQWIDSTKGRKKSEKYGRNFLLVDNQSLLRNPLVTSMSTKDSLVLLKRNTQPEDDGRGYFTYDPDSDAEYRTVYGDLTRINAAQLLPKRRLDYLIFGLEGSPGLDTQPVPESFDRIEAQLSRAAFLLRGGGCLVAAVEPAGLGFVNLALRRTGFRSNSQIMVELPRNFKAVKAIT